MANLILFGPPGSGKGTQAETIKTVYNLHHISTGDLLRDEVSRQTPLGIEAKRYMDQGLLLPDELVIKMISNCIDTHSTAKGFLFDGFPRTKAQAEALDRLMHDKSSLIHQVIKKDVISNTLIV